VNDFPEITTEQIVARLRMIVTEPDSLCKTDLPYIEDAAHELESKGDEITRLTAQRDEAWLKIGHIRNEIDCRIEHGADSNGHLEAIRNMIDKEEADSNNELFRKGQI
jgi:hypothetical protein